MFLAMRPTDQFGVAIPVLELWESNTSTSAIISEPTPPKTHEK